MSNFIDCLSLIKVDNYNALKLQLPIKVAENLTRISVYKYVKEKWELKKVISSNSMYGNPCYIQPAFSGLYKVVLKLSSGDTTTKIDSNIVEVVSAVEKTDTDNGWIKVSDATQDQMKKALKTRFVQVWRPNDAATYHENKPSGFIYNNVAMTFDESNNSDCVKLAFWWITGRDIHPMIYDAAITHFRFLPDDAPEDL